MRDVRHAAKADERATPTAKAGGERARAEEETESGPSGSATPMDGGDDVEIGGGANPVTAFHAAADVESVKPGGILVWIAPDGAAVAAGASDILRMVASAGTVPRRAIVFGRSS